MIHGSPIRKAAEISMIARPKFLPMDIIVRTPFEIEEVVQQSPPVRNLFLPKNGFTSRFIEMMDTKVVIGWSLQDILIIK
ncbi:MAG: hypothetical protein K8R25_01125 [Methanosarcinales archaeon]|nr:hypothetical protein [Methanosarcinales archaeon]